MELTDWLSIGALIVSGFSLFLSWRISQRDKLRGEYNYKRDLFFAAKHHLDALKERHTSSKEDDERLDFDLEKFFSKKVLKKFKQAEEAISEMWPVSDDMGVLFQTLHETNPQESERLEALFDEDPGLNPQAHRELQDYLDKWVICFLQDDPWRRRTRYSYREIENELKRATEKADAKCSDFESAAMRQIKYR